MGWLVGNLNNDICSCTFLTEENYGEQKTVISLCFNKKEQVKQDTPRYYTHEEKDLKVIQILEIWLDN